MYRFRHFAEERDSDKAHHPVPFGLDHHVVAHRELDRIFSGFRGFDLGVTAKDTRFLAAPRFEVHLLLHGAIVFVRSFHQIDAVIHTVFTGHFSNELDRALTAILELDFVIVMNGEVLGMVGNVNNGF